MYYVLDNLLPSVSITLYFFLLFFSLDVVISVFFLLFLFKELTFGFLELLSSMCFKE